MDLLLEAHFPRTSVSIYTLARFIQVVSFQFSPAAANLFMGPEGNREKSHAGENDAPLEHHPRLRRPR